MIQHLNNNATGQKLWLFIHHQRKTSILKTTWPFPLQWGKEFVEGQGASWFSTSFFPFSLVPPFKFWVPTHPELNVGGGDQPGSFLAWRCSMSRLRIGKLHIIQISQYWWLLAKPVDLYLLHVCLLTVASCILCRSSGLCLRAGKGGGGAQGPNFLEFLK